MKQNSQRGSNKVPISTPFATIPLCIISDDRLSKRQIRVLLALFRHWNPKRQKDLNIVWPSRRVLSQWTGYKESLISTITTELERLDWLTKSGNGGCSRSVRYTLNPEQHGTEARTVVDAIMNNREEDSCSSSQTLHEVVDQNSNPRVVDSTIRTSSNQEVNGTQNEEGQRTKKEKKNEQIKEEVSARDQLARRLVDDFFSFFSGLGLGISTKPAKDKVDTWCEDFLQLLDDGVLVDEFLPMYEWLLKTNPQREFPFKVRNPTELREKWHKLVVAASDNVERESNNDNTLEYIKIEKHMYYAQKVIEVNHEKCGLSREERILTRLLDERNKISRQMAFFICLFADIREGIFELSECYRYIMYEEDISPNYALAFNFDFHERIKFYMDDLLEPIAHVRES